MDIPEKLLIGGHEIPISLHAGADMGDNLGTWGEKNGIRLRLGTVEDIRAETLMHEIFEMIKHSHDLRDISHTSLTVLAEGLFAAIRQNNLDFRRPTSGRTA